MTHSIKIGPYEDGIAPSYVDFTCTEPEGSRCRVWCDHGCTVEAEHEDNGCELYDQGYCGWIEGWFDDAGVWQVCYEGDGDPDRDGDIDFHHHGEDGPTWFYVTTDTVCPDCRDGKHGACVGAAWDDEKDAPADCQCACQEGKDAE